MLNVDLNSVSLLDEEKRKTILQNIKFDIEKGKVYTILGKNGSGKSTLIKSLTAQTVFTQQVASGAGIRRVLWNLRVIPAGPAGGGRGGRGGGGGAVAPPGAYQVTRESGGQV